MSIRSSGVMWASCVVLALVVACAPAERTETGEPGDAEPGGIPEAPILPIGAAKLGLTKGDLEGLFGSALRPVEPHSRRSLAQQIVELAPPKGAARPTGGVQTFPGQLRLGRSLSGPDVVAAEYDLHEDRVYRLRWRLTPRFERPIMQPFVAHLQERFGDPIYDQTLEAKLESRRPALRRAGWVVDGRVLELRQFHPFMGGALFLTLFDKQSLEAIKEAGRVVLPQPDHDKQWWQRTRAEPSLPTKAELRALLTDLDALLARMDLPRIEPDVPAR